MAISAPSSRRVVRIVLRARGDAFEALFMRVAATPDGSPARKALAASVPELAARFLIWQWAREGTGSGTIALRFSGRIDGSERIVISMDDARWENVHWGISRTTVELGGVKWTPRESRVLTNSGSTRFLPVAVDFKSARLHRHRGRDTVTLETGDESVKVLIADNPNGSDLYEFDILVRPVSVYAELRIRARIEGRDELTITSEGAKWRMLWWGWPHSVRLGEVTWTPRDRPRLPNAGDTRFLRDGVDLSTARLVARKGRDLVGLEVRSDRLVVRFADTPVGASDYEAVIRFGP